MKDAIRIQELELFVRIGVPDEERATAQKLLVNLTLYPSRGLAGLDDRVENTVDYFEVCQAVMKFAEASDCRLIETLAEGIGDLLLNRFPLSEVEIELRKFIIPQTAFVAVTMRREHCN